MTSQGPRKPARQQVDAPVTAHEEVHAAGTINIWTGRVLKEFRKPRESRKKEVSKYRCLGKIDSGWTRGEGSGAAYCCLYFARGICHLGPQCDFLHRVPRASDEERHRTDYSHDIFGRERVPGSLDGRKKGVGSYERECKTLYVNYGGAGTLPTDKVRSIVGENFAEWGPIENIHLVPSKTLAFIRFQWRCSAEFAKAAMHQQTLRGCDTTEVLDVRWANDDPNPRAIVRVQQEREEAMRDAYAKAVNELEPDAKRARIQQLHLQATTRPGLASAAYPNTDGQYGGTYKHTYEGWDQLLYRQEPELEEYEEQQIEEYEQLMAAEEQQQQQQQQAEEEEQQEGAQQEVEAGAEQQQDAQGGEEAAGQQQGGEDEAAQWAAWREWQQQHNPHGTYAIPGAAAEDGYARYMRPEDHYWEAVRAQQLAAAAGGEAAAAGGALTDQQQTATVQEGKDEAAEQALGLIAGYGSDSDAE